MTEDRERYIGQGEPMNDDDEQRPVTAWCRKRLAREQSALAGLRTGSWRMTEMQAGERVDITDRIIVETEASIAELEQLLATWKEPRMMPIYRPEPGVDKDGNPVMRLPAGVFRDR